MSPAEKIRSVDHYLFDLLIEYRNTYAADYNNLFTTNLHGLSQEALCLWIGWVVMKHYITTQENLEADAREAIKVFN